MRVLLLGSNKDQHIAAVKQQLINQNHNPIFIDIYHDFSNFSYHFSNAGVQIQIENNDISTINSIYWRYPIQDNKVDDVFSIEELYAKQEIWNFFLPLDAISKLKCINPMLTNICMEDKIFQLSLAAKSKLTIPNTLITSNAAQIQKFVNGNPQNYIKKVLGMAWNEDKNPSETRLLELSNLTANTSVPSIVQSHIKRKTEFRIYVIDNNIIPVEICLGEQYKNQIDWRSVDFNGRGYKRYDLPELLRRDILSYHQASHLVYAAYDFIIDENDQVFFLECNPNGNWLFLPAELAHEVTSAIVNSLTTRRNNDEFS